MEFEVSVAVVPQDHPANGRLRQGSNMHIARLRHPGPTCVSTCEPVCSALGRRADTQWELLVMKLRLVVQPVT